MPTPTNPLGNYVWISTTAIAQRLGHAPSGAPEGILGSSSVAVGDAAEAEEAP